MTRRPIVAGVVMVMLLAANYIQAESCRIVNGSFENDGWGVPDVTVKDPNGWDANVPAGKFFGYVKQDWPTDGAFNLTLDSWRWVVFDVNDMTAVSQQVNLTGIDEVTFDLKLDIYPTIYPWEPGICTAVVLIDGNAVWESNSTGSDVRGEYFDQAYTVESKYKDGQKHLLSFGMRFNTAGYLSPSYKTHWDSIGCTVFCGGGGFLPADFDRNCYVDANDLKLIAELWLETIEPNDKCNLFHGDDSAGSGFINFPDFANFADLWDSSVSRLGTFANKWLQTVDANDPDNLSHLDDVLDPKGIINFFDLAKFADTWLGSSYVEEP